MTHRLDANLLPWLTPGSSVSRKAVHNATVLRSYVPLYGVQGGRVRGPVHGPHYGAPEPECAHAQLRQPPVRTYAYGSQPLSGTSTPSRSRVRIASPSSGYGSWMETESAIPAASVGSSRLGLSPADTYSMASDQPAPAPPAKADLRDYSKQPAGQKDTPHQPVFKDQTNPRSRPSSSTVRLERRHRSQTKRPASAAASIRIGQPQPTQGVSVQGQGYGGDRPAMLLKVHHPPVPQDAPPPFLGWMNIARRAQLHTRPQSSKPRDPRPNPPKRRVASAPPRLRSRPVQDPPVPTYLEVDSAPPTTPANSTPRFEPDPIAIDDTPAHVEVDIQWVPEEVPPVNAILEEPEAEEEQLGQEDEDILEVFGPDQVEEVVVAEEPPEPEPDEGYAGDTDTTDKEPEEEELEAKRKLQRASFGPKKKQSLLDGKDLLDEYMRMRNKTKKGSGAGDSGDGDRSVPAWMKSRLMPSKRSCRFELPLDIRLLEGMSPAEYLSNFCVVSDRRQKWFNQAFTTVDRERKGHLGRKELKIALTKVHSDALNEDDVQLLVEVVGLEGKFEVGRKLFHGIAALSERVLSSKIEATAFSQSRRDLLEEADFEALQWKLRGVNVREELLGLFNHITV